MRGDVRFGGTIVPDVARVGEGHRDPLLLRLKHSSRMGTPGPAAEEAKVCIRAVLPRCGGYARRKPGRQQGAGEGACPHSATTRLFRDGGCRSGG